MTETQDTPQAGMPRAVEVPGAAPGAREIPQANGPAADGGVGAGRALGDNAPGAGEARQAGPACQNCGRPLEQGQDWCLECGAARPGSLGPSGPGWRSATTVLGVTAALVLGAAAAAYAALSQPGPRRAAPRVITVAQVPTTPPVTTPPPTSTPGAVTPPSTVKPLPTTSTPEPLPKLPPSAPPPSAPNPIPVPKAPAPKPNASSREGSGTGGEPSTPNESTPTTGGETTAGEAPAPILLDTNAASTYNPYAYPASNFGDPSLAIDGETSTGWTAQVDPAVAPKMAEGLAIDLKTPQRVASVTLVSSTPGMTVEVYGANSSALPTSITDPAWVALSGALDAKKRRTKIPLRDPGKAHRFFTLWISRAPKSAAGTSSAPGRVSINELELFAAK